jgi:two-component system chemotaxis response regulator CheY
LGRSEAAEGLQARPAHDFLRFGQRQANSSYGNGAGFSRAAPLAGPRLALPTVFVVDDEVYIQELYQHMLPAGGFDVAGSAYNGSEAVQVYPTLSPAPDLIIMDHRMPVKNGVEATREILLYNPSARIVVISADATAREKAKAAGAVEFIEKPFNMGDLFMKLKACLE